MAHFSDWSVCFPRNVSVYMGEMGSIYLLIRGHLWTCRHGLPFCFFPFDESQMRGACVKVVTLLRKEKARSVKLPLPAIAIGSRHIADRLFG